MKKKKLAVEWAADIKNKIKNDDSISDANDLQDLDELADLVIEIMNESRRPLLDILQELLADWREENGLYPTNDDHPMMKVIDFFEKRN